MKKTPKTNSAKKSTPPKNTKPVQPKPGKKAVSSQKAAPPQKAAPSQNEGGRPSPKKQIDISLAGTRTEQREAPVRRVTRGEARRKRRRRKIFAVLLAFATVGVGLLLSITVLFPIQGFRVEGESPYTQDELAAAFGYASGENIFRFRIADAEEKMAQALPFLETIKVRRSLPGTVVFLVTPAAETYCVATDASNLILSKERKVLRMAQTPPDGICKISGISATADSKVGETMRCADADSETLLSTFLTSLNTWFPEGVTAIDLTNSLEMNFIYQGRMLVKLGTVSQLDYKMQLAAKTLQDNLGTEEQGTMDASYPGKVYVSDEILWAGN